MKKNFGSIFFLNGCGPSVTSSVSRSVKNGSSNFEFFFLSFDRTRQKKQKIYKNYIVKLNTLRNTGVGSFRKSRG